MARVWMTAPPKKRQVLLTLQRSHPSMTLTMLLGACLMPATAEMQ